MTELSLHIQDIIQNSITAGSSVISVIIEEDVPNDKYTITIEDDGKGMDDETVKKVSDPFYLRAQKLPEIGCHCERSW